VLPSATKQTLALLQFLSNHPLFIFFFLNKRSDTDLGNLQSAPRGGETIQVS